MSMNEYINKGISKVTDTDASNAKAYFSNANETLRHAGHYMVEVLDGVHAGSKYTQKSGSLVIGSSSESDIILFGSNAAPRHFEVIMTSGVLTKLQVKPIDAPITLEDGSIVEVGQYADIGSDEIISFADTEISISRIADPKSFLKPAVRVLAIICVLAMVPLVYGIAASFIGNVAEAGSRVASSVQSGIELTSGKILGNTSQVTPTKEIDEAFAWTVRVKLEDLKLNHKLRATPTSDGSIRVYGNISDKELPRWTNFLQWYDSSAHFPPLIRDISRVGIDNNLPKIKSVWLDSNPSVFFKDGVVGGVGSKIKDGWKIVDINNSSVMIERDGTVVSLTF